MLEKALSRIMLGAKTPEGKVIAILLTISLALMCWNVTSINTAFANDESSASAESSQAAETTQTPEPEAEEPAAVEAAPEPAAEEPAAVEEAPESEAESVEEAAPEPEAEELAEEAAPEPEAYEPAASVSESSSAAAVSDEVASSSSAAANGETASSRSAAASSEAAANKPEASPSSSSAAADKSSESAAKKEVTYPAVTLEGTIGTITVTLEAPKGALPEGAKMTVDPATQTDEELAAKVEAGSGKAVKELKAMNIKLTDADGKAIQPKAEVAVKIAGANVEGDDFAVYRINDDATIEKVSTTVPATASQQQFAASELKPYIVAGLTEKAADKSDESADKSDASASSEAADKSGESADKNGVTEEMPAQAFLKSASNGVTASVVAPEGAFPKGTKMTVTAVAEEDVIDAVEAALEDGKVVKNVAAVDITFTNAAGEEIEPKVPISVSLKSSVVLAAEEPVVVHIDDADDATVVADAKASANTMTFDSDAFSVYVVVDTGQQDENARLAINFVQYGGQTITILVKELDTTEPNRFAQVLYDPGAGDLPQSVAFYGWTPDDEYTTESDMLTIEDVRTAVQQEFAQGVEEGDSVTYYAAVFKAFIVTYKDSHGVVLGSDTNMEQPDATSSDYTIQMSYAVEDPDQDFKGWHISPIANATLADGTPVTETGTYENGTDIKLLGSVTMTVEAPMGAWLIFRENGSGATYTRPQFLEPTDVTQKPANPTRNGFTFGGWYENPECTGDQFQFGSPLSTTKQLYAKWDENTEAKYTVLLWKQNVAGDGYDFYKSWTFENATVGHTITQEGKVRSSGTGNNAYATIDGVQYRASNNDPQIKEDFKGFHFDHFDPALSTTVSSQGDTVINVYYDRNEYTLTFQTYGGFWAGWRTIATITALYEQDISSYFAQGAQLNGYYWDPQRSSTFDYGLAAIATMPAENITFHGDRYNTSHNMFFYVEALDYDAPNLVTYQGKKFELLTTASASGYKYLTFEEDFIKRIGYERYYFHGYNDRGFDQEMSAAEFEAAKETREYQGTADFFYTRSTYNVTFMDGIYLSGNSNEQVADRHTQQLSESDPIAYGASLADLADYKPTGSAGWVFSGWYLDAACTEPATFSSMNMPEGGLTVYAKWHNTQYRVFLHPNVPTTTPDDYMGGQSTSFRMDYGDQLGFIDAYRDGYELVGWYMDEGYTKQFKFEAYTFNDTNITGTYDKTRSTELDLYGNATASTNADVDRPWINNCLDLYARWRSSLEGAEGINVVYDPGDGTGTPTDDLLYKDLAMAHVGSATIPTDTNKVFSHWEPLKYENGEWVATGEKAYPGSTFEVRKAYAHEEDITDPDNPEHTKKYTVMLRAVYVDKDQDTPTHIYWYPNGGTPTTEVKVNTLEDGTTAGRSPLTVP